MKHPHRSRRVVLIIILLHITVLFTLAPAAEYTQWRLPDGAIARLGKEKIKALAYAPDGHSLAIATSIGVWFYDAHTGEEIALLTGDK